MKRTKIAVMATMVLAATLTALTPLTQAADAVSPVFPDRGTDDRDGAIRVDEWHGYKRYVFTCDGLTAWVVEPETPRSGNPWIWAMMFPNHFWDRLPAYRLLDEGFYYAFIGNGNTFGCPSALKHMDAFYAYVTDRGLSKKVVLSALSRGGLFAYGWARQNPDKITCIYADGAVCDFKSWPGGKLGQGRGSQDNWEALIQCYGFDNEADALAWPHNPVDSLQPLAEAGVPLIHVTGDSDRTVPMEENTDVVEQRYKALGGKITVTRKPGGDHHPHGLDDPTPVVEMILNYHQNRGSKN